MAMDTDIRALNARIDHLEDNRRYIQNALEMVLSLEDFYTEIGGDNYSLETLLPEAKRRIDAIFPFDVLAFYMVDETDLSFQPAYRHPERLADEIQQEVAFMIDEGYFAWAIRERRGVVISSKDHSRQYLLHVIANHNQVKGMFGGLLPTGQAHLPDAAMTLLSIILLHVANASESMAYTNLLKNQSRILESQVAERTQALTQSQQELQEAMERARAMAEAAQAANRAKGDFLAKMSHELRTPLNGIIGMTEVALSTGLDDNQRRIIEIIARESFSLLAQINDVLDFSKIESGKLELEQIEFDLRTLLEEVGENFIFQTSEKRLELNVFIDPSVPTRLVGDPVRLRQILVNLAGNAVKFTQDGEILIEAERDSSGDSDGRIRFRITDSGIGISADKLDGIFSSFTQADNSTTRQFGGTGLGTTISKQLVELMGGQIGVDSQPGKGSTFWFTAEFDLQPDGQVALMADAVGGDNPTALVVDGCQTTARILRIYLDQLGVGALSAADGKAALDLLSERSRQGQSIDAIITADRIADMDGLTLKNRIRQLADYATVPLIVATSLETLVANHDHTRSFDAVVSKPVKLADLKTALKQAIHGVAPEVPQAEEHSQEAAIPESQGMDRRQGHILVADDYPVNRKVAFMHLTAAGFSVDLVDNGQQAVDAFGCNDYELILMDIQMPVLNGFDATAKIRQMERDQGRDRSIPIIALTANAMKGDEQKCLDAGMDGYLTKPVHRHQLIKTAEHWIGLRGTQAHQRTEDLPQAPVAAVSNEPAIMDTTTAVEEFGDAETVKMVAQQLIENVDGQLQAIQDAIAGGDREAVRKEAHAIKGGAATMEAVALSKAAAHLEDLSSGGHLDALGAGAGDLHDQFNRFREFISQWKGN
jgi:signal transduction histidine kinase/CheY-like chemotaxis protein